MLSYLQGETVPVGEARIVFLGAPGAGRTSLINCLDQKPICPGEPATPRVAIRQRLEQIQGKKVLVHYWDFGGQVVMHATHQFFLRKNALYVVVLNIRRDDSPESWLNHIKTFADGSPTLIVLNKTDLLPQGPLPQPSFDLKRIRKQYSFVIDPVFCLSCKNREGFDAFQTRLYELLGSDHILKTDRPLEWFRVKEALTRGNQDFIPRQEFHQICQDQKLNEQSEKTMLEMLDTLGVVASFPELETHTDIVLNPEWITKAIYHIICACEKKDGFSGELSEKLMKQLFAKARNDPDFDIVIPDDKCLFLLELMQSFKLVFSLPGPENRYYVPMLAPINEPPHMVSRKDSLHLLLTFTFLSPELFYRFVVKSSREIVDGLIWRNGVILGQGINRLLIEYNKYQRTLECYAQGDDPGEYLNDILKRIQDIIHSDDKQVLCRPYIVLKNGDGFDVEDLKIRYLKNGYDSEEHGKKTWGTYTTIDLLKQLFGGNYEKIIAKEIEGELGSLNINININVQISWNLQELLDAKNQIKDLVRATKSFKRKNESAPVERKEQLDDLENGFDDLKDELDDLYDLQDKKAKKDDKRVKSAFRSINSFIDGLKKTDEAMDSVLGIGEKLASIADTVAKVLGAWPC
ncbi:GTP-binding protein [Desulfosarcina sp. OttesenSCG-928-G17]|nr:GTP-binding protein [Desulfosarcina sp. OttesenSCG-928-G17]